jgi:hypothetical protein
MFVTLEHWIRHYFDFHHAPKFGRNLRNQFFSNNLVWNRNLGTLEMQFLTRLFENNRFHKFCEIEGTRETLGKLVFTTQIGIHQNWNP